MKQIWKDAKTQLQLHVRVTSVTRSCNERNTYV